MLFYTHLTFSFLVGILLSKIINITHPISYFIFILIGTLIPDLDHSNSKLGNKLKFFSKTIELLFGRRGLMHTIYLSLLISGIIYFFLNKEYGLSMFIGYTSHLILDGFTKEGVNILQPLSNLTLSGFIKTGGVLENIIFIILVLLIIFLLI